MSKKVLCLLAFVSICVNLLVAQNPRGSLRGTVLDASAARVASANVIVESVSSSLKRETRSGNKGEFRLDDLRPGAYRVTVSARGFAAAISSVVIELSSVRDVVVTLKAETAPETVNVRGQASSITTQPIDLASAVHQGVVTNQDLETLPLAARSFANIAYLAPGTEPVEPSDPTKARITAVSTGGSSGLNNDLSVDGGDNSDDWIGGFLQNFSPDAIQEFAVRTANEDADTGRHDRRIGRDHHQARHQRWHGERAFYERAAALNARFPIENPRAQIPSSRSRARITWARSAARSRRTRSGSSPRSNTCTRTPASPTAREQRRISTRSRIWPRTA